jgi:hypothetical protein
VLPCLTAVTQMPTQSVEADPFDRFNSLDGKRSVVMMRGVVVDT